MSTHDDSGGRLGLTYDELAERKFGVLSTAERELVNSLGVERESKDEDCADRAREIRAQMLRWLLFDAACQREIKQRGGIWLSGCSILGELWLDDLVVDFPVALERCTFEEPLHLERTELSYMSLKNSRCDSVFASGMRVKGDVNLRGLSVSSCHELAVDSPNTRPRGICALDDAHIGGVLDCRNAIFSRPTSHCFSASRVRIDGSCDLTEVKATGLVSLTDACIAGVVDCTGAEFVNLAGEPLERHALDLDRARIDGACFMRGHFKAHGLVTLRNAQIRGNLDCCNSSFFRPVARPQDPDKSYSLDLSYVAVGGELLFENLAADGAVDLRCALVSGDLDFKAAKLNGAPLALNANRARINGLFDLSGAKWTGSVEFALGTCSALLVRADSSERVQRGLILKHASCVVLDDEPEAWGEHIPYDLQGFRYEFIMSMDDDGDKRIGWLSRGKTSKSRQPYEQLSRVLRSAGHTEESKKVLIAREKKCARRKFPGFAWNLLYGAVVDYGHNPAKALYWLGALWLVGWVAICLGNGVEAFFPAMDRVYVEQAQRRTVEESAITSPNSDARRFIFPQAYPALVPATYALDALVPFLDLNQERYWSPDLSKGSGLAVQAFLWVYTIFGWILASFGVVAITGLVKRD